MDATTLAQILDVLQRYVFNIANLQGMLRLATPVILAGLCALITARAGILNIAGEGMILFGAWFGVAGSYYFTNAFAGLLRGARTELVKCGIHDLQVPASAEIVLEGFLHPGDEADEGPFGDHTGYYNEVERFPVFTIERITHRRDPIYHSTYTGRPPDEPAILGVALNEVFVPILQKQFPEITDFYLPPEGCSYRVAIVSMKKQYPGHAKRVMFGVWSFLRQFMYTKFVIVTDDDIDIRDWKDVIWAMTTRMDPVRDTTLVGNTPIDYLDFASPVSGLGGKIGFDATNKMKGETDREWGRPIVMSDEVKRRVDAIWDQLFTPRDD